MKVVARLLVSHKIVILMLSNYERRDLRDRVLAVGSDWLSRSVEVLDTSLINMLSLCRSIRSILWCQFWLSLLSWLMHDRVCHIRRLSLRLILRGLIRVACEASCGLLSILLI